MKFFYQFFRYAAVGLSSNAILYLGYLLLTRSGVGHKTAMTFLYILGVIQTFYFNRRWTFYYRGGHVGSLARYATTYGFGYVLNLTLLVLLVDKFGYPHEVVQGCLILTVAVMIFLCQKFWVFPATIRANFEN